MRWDERWEHDNKNEREEGRKKRDEEERWGRKMRKRSMWIKKKRGKEKRKEKKRKENKNEKTDIIKGEKKWGWEEAILSRLSEKEERSEEWKRCAWKMKVIKNGRE